MKPIYWEDLDKDTVEKCYCCNEKAGIFISIKNKKIFLCDDCYDWLINFICDECCTALG